MGRNKGMTHIEYDEFGAYEETIDLVPVGAAQDRKQVAGKATWS